MQKFTDFFKRLFDVKVEQKIDANNTRESTFNQTANIFNFLIPSIILAAGLVALGIWGLREYQNSKYNLAPMSGNINVAVARFSDLTNNQCNLSKDVGLLISDSFFTRLESDGLKDEFYKDSSTILQVRSPVELPELQGDTETRITKSAEELASTINAHIVVYGIVTCSEITKQAYFQVMFFIAPSNFGDAQEIIGAFSFSADVIYGDVSAGQTFEDLNTELQQKVQVTSLLIKGIGSFLGEKYPLSLQYLEQAKDSTLWGTQDGQEVIYIIEGNAESKLAHSLNIDGNESEALDVIEKARASYEQANEISKANPQKGEYGRAYIGLAGVEDFYMTRKAILTDKLGDLDLSAKSRMEKMLNDAEAAAYNPPTADIPIKVAFYRAHISLLLYKLDEKKYLEAKDKSLLIDAENNYKLVVNEFEGIDQKEKNLRIRELAARSYSGLALIARFNGNEKSALDYLQLAADASHVPGLKLQYLLSLGDAYERNGDLKHALGIYKEVLVQRKELEQQMSEKKITDLENKVAGLENSLITPNP